MPEAHSRARVLVVGGGPVGLTMASELVRHGVDCRLIDKNPAPQPWSKAAAVSARTMEAFQDMGIVERMLAKGRPMYGANLYTKGKRIAHLQVELPGTPYPYIFGLSQRDTELTLADHFEQLGGTFERSVELTGFEQDDDGVRATIVHPDGSEEVVTAAWLIGCDGAKSSVRSILGLPFEGSTFEQTVVQADIRIDFPLEVDPNEAIAFLSDAGPLAALPLLDEGRYRLIAVNVPSEDENPPLSLYEKLARERGPKGMRVYDPAWTASFRFHGRIVPHYRTGRVFLAGDAGHIHSPVGGQGMNLGIQDAYNLAWKLALVIRGRGRPDLLDSYQPERWPIGNTTVNLTDRATKNMLRMMTIRSPIVQSVRNQIASLVLNSGLVQDRVFRGLGGMTVDYSASPIAGEYHSSIWLADVGRGRDRETPHVSDWYKFTKGPGPGERVPDIELPEKVGSASTLFELMRGTQHTLLLFDGAASTGQGYANLSSIAMAVDERCGGDIRTHVIVPGDSIPDAITWRESVIRDVDTSLHEHFGCGSEALYLIRPDGHVGFRSQPALESQLFEYLNTIFVL